MALETLTKKAPGFLLLASENSYLGVGKALNWERSSRLNPGVGLGSGVAERFLQPLKFQRQVVCQEWLCFQDAHPLPFPEGSFSTYPSRSGCHFSSSVQVQTGQDRPFCLATRRPRLTGPKWPEMLPTPQASSECPSLPVTARCVSVEGNHCLWGEKTCSPPPQQVHGQPGQQLQPLSTPPGQLCTTLPSTHSGRPGSRGSLWAQRFVSVPWGEYCSPLPPFIRVLHHPLRSHLYLPLCLLALPRDPWEPVISAVRDVPLQEQTTGCSPGAEGWEGDPHEILRFPSPASAVKLYWAPPVCTQPSTGLLGHRRRGCSHPGDRTDWRRKLDISAKGLETTQICICSMMLT